MNADIYIQYMYRDFKPFRDRASSDRIRFSCASTWRMHIIFYIPHVLRIISHIYVFICTYNNNVNTLVLPCNTCALRFVF